MVVFEQSDFEKMAAEAVQAFFAGAPLNDTVFKIACEQGLTPPMIRQVAWLANTKTHLDLFEKKAEESDRYVEFQVCDPDYVISRLYRPPEEQPLPVKTAAASRELDFFSPVVDGTEKVAAEDSSIFVEEKPVSAKTAADRKGKATRLMQKAAYELEQNMYMEREGYMDAIHDLATELRKRGGRDEFEKDAFAIHGESILPILNDVRAVYRLEPTTIEKVACDYERLVDTSSAYFQTLKTAETHYTEAVKYAQSLKWLKTKLGGVL